MRLEDLPSPETMLAYASILEKPQYQIDPKTGAKHRLATGEVVEAACAALRFCAGMWVCTGCGSHKSIEQIRTEKPQAIACCPERKFSPAMTPSHRTNADVGGANSSGNRNGEA